MRVCQRAEVVSFILPYLLWDRKEEKHHKLKAWCQSLVVHRLRRGFQVGEVQEHKVSPRGLTQVWGKGGQTRLSQPECWFPHLKRCERWEGHQGDKATYSTRTSWSALNPHWPILSWATWNKCLWVAVSSSSSPFPLRL